MRHIPTLQISDKNENGYRYNLLPSEKQHGGPHTNWNIPQAKKDILTREEVLEVYEKYYNYTVKTNDAGDFMIWEFLLVLRLYILILIYPY
jgi:hypothetical protein